MLDTDTCIWVLRGREPVLTRVRTCSPDDLCIAAMVLAELRFGALRSSRPQDGEAQVDAFLAAPLQVLPFDAEAAEWHARLRSALRQQPIGERDLIIASIARSRDLVLVTGNQRELGRVPGLEVEDWTRA